MKIKDINIGYTIHYHLLSIQMGSHTTHLILLYIFKTIFQYTIIHQIHHRSFVVRAQTYSLHSLFSVIVHSPQSLRSCYKEICFASLRFANILNCKLRLLLARSWQLTRSDEPCSRTYHKYKICDNGVNPLAARKIKRKCWRISFHIPDKIKCLLCGLKISESVS